MPHVIFRKLKVETFVVDKSGHFQICCLCFFSVGDFTSKSKFCGNSKLCFRVPLKKGLPPKKRDES